MREEIYDGVFAPGTRLVESTFCARYEVSRTVIREALRQLESEGLVTVVPNRGPIVTVLSEKDIVSLYVVRRNLEGLAGELFARHATAEQVASLLRIGGQMRDSFLSDTIESRNAVKDAFYDTLLEGTGNEILAEMLRGIHARIGLFRRFAFVDPVRAQGSMEEVLSIIHAAAALRDPVLARRACEEHIERAGQLAVIEYTRRMAGCADDPDNAEAATSPAP